MGKHSEPPVPEDTFGIERWPEGAQRQRAYITELVMSSGLQCEPEGYVRCCRLLDEWIKNGSPASTPSEDGKILSIRWP